jgi:uncharacterized repeat protein (TIGR03803 family)
MKTRLTIRPSASCRAIAKRRRVMRLLWAVVLVLPTLGAQAAAVLTTLHSFNGTTDGGNPDAGLVQGSDGYFYGTTVNDGTSGYGTVFQISTNGALTTLYSFNGGNEGAAPDVALVQGSDGYFYGTTDNGGTNGHWGTVFKISTNGALTTLYSFTGGNDGGCPVASLVQGSDGNFYGTTVYGGTGGGVFGYGTVFQISTNGALMTLYAFGSITNANGDPLDGSGPDAAMVQGSDGNLYGTTEYGGTNSYFVPGRGGGYWVSFGTVFEITTDGAFTSLYSFTGGNDGYWPNGLVQGSDGYLYVTTYASGVFEITTNGSLNNLFPLDVGLNGLVEGSDGYFYGTTDNGGTNGYGTVFKISTNGALTTFYSFTGNTDGGNPDAGLVQGSDGSFYGTTPLGGANNFGTVFRLTIVPEFQATTLTNGTLSLTWSTEAGGTYQLQYTSDLSSSNWANLNSPITATGATLSTTDSVTNGPQRFYRLVLSP